MNVTDQLIEQIIQEQHALFYNGHTRSLQFRKDMLEQLYETIQTHEDEVLDALHKDLGKSPFEAYSTEVGFVLTSIRYMIEHLDEWSAPKKVKTPLHLQPAQSFIEREPYGSICIIGPFNYPFQLVMEPLIGAIAGGNCAVVKPSEFAEATGKVIDKILTTIYPPNFVRVVFGEKEETSALIHGAFDYIFFTGSTQVGKVVMKAAAERLTPITLELGGKSPVIVDQTANIKNAAERIIWGKLLNVGQTCVAPDYIVVHHHVKEQLIHQLKKAIVRFYGKKIEANDDYGRIIHERHFDRLLSIIREHEQQIVFGGQSNRETLYIEPTLLSPCTWDDAAMQDEIFGPILPILEYQHLDEVIHQIRQRPKPLSAYFFTENEQAEAYFIERLPFGGGCINDTVSHVGNLHLPFGGVGASGMNAYHGKASFERFSREKAMMKRSTNIPMKVAHPPYKKKFKLMKRFMK